MEPNIRFAPTITIQTQFPVSLKNIETFVFNLGLVESISYWKASCSPQITVRAGKLGNAQKNWWKDLFIRGLGEFYYKNGINFSADNFLSIDSVSRRSYKPSHLPNANGDLILASGGSDSAVTLELLKNPDKKESVLLLNPTKAAFSIVKAAGYKDRLIVSREIDAKLLQLNSQGYLNGHTPFSAYLAFLGTFVAALYNYKNVIVSNERSADEGNLRYHNIDVNHAYSKSGRFEKLFRNYCAKCLSGDINYFSMLRPIYELQVTKIFAIFSKYFELFRSCNAGQKENIWCGKCAKCAFSYVALSPFISRKQLAKIFGNDYFKERQLAKYFKTLTGLVNNKPFECVGTIDESRIAVKLAVEQYKKSGLQIPAALDDLATKLGATTKKDDRIFNSWRNKHFLPTIYEGILKSYVG